MKKTLMWCFIGLLSLGSAAWSQAQTTGRTEKAVAELEQQWLQSQKTNNPDLVAPLLADKFVITGSDGKVRNKTESLTNAKATKYVSAQYEDMKVTVFGDTAIATSVFNAKGTDEFYKRGSQEKTHLQRLEFFLLRSPLDRARFVLTYRAMCSVVGQ